MRVTTVITRLEGGAGVLALRGVLALDQAAYQPVIITGSGGRLAAEAASQGIEVLVEPMLTPNLSPRSDLRAVRWLTAELAARQPDVVHTHCAKGGAIGRLAARKAGIGRLVHTYHGFPFHEFQSVVRRGAYVAAERRLGRFTDVGLCVGTGVAVEAIRRGLIAPERIRTIGVMLEPGAQESSGRAAPGPATPGAARREARLRLGLPPGAVVVGAVGRLTYQKAPEDFVAAISALGRPDVTGVWVGGGELAAKVATLAAKSGQRVVLTGDRADVSELLPGFDVFALPSRYEGLPTAVAEAMACGVPVIATAVNAVADLVEPGVSGLLVPPGRPDLLASGIGYLLDSPATATAMAAAARARIGPRYGIGALRTALAAAYQPDEAGRRGETTVRAITPGSDSFNSLPGERNGQTAAAAAPKAVREALRQLTMRAYGVDIGGYDMTGILDDRAIDGLIGDRAARESLTFGRLPHSAQVIFGPEPEYLKVPASAGPRLLAGPRRGPGVTQVISIG